MASFFCAYSPSSESVRRALYMINMLQMKLTVKLWVNDKTLHLNEYDVLGVQLFQKPNKHASYVHSLFLRLAFFFFATA